MKKSFLTLLAMVLVFGLSFIACDNGNGTNDGHTHSYGTTWSYNATQHYKQCSCGEKIDVENHTGDPCTVCGYTSGSIVDPPTAKYIITGSGTTFTATKDGEPVGTANSAIQTVIDDIQTNANGANIEIQFGTGSVLDTGANGIKFNNTDGTWGVITLSGKLKMSVNSTSNAIQISDNVSVISTADIENDNTTVSFNYAIGNYGTGTLTINSGTVKGTGGKSGAVENGGLIITNGKLIINGGTLSGIDKSAVYNNGTATITGGSFTSEDEHTIQNKGTMTISNATITSDTGYAIHNGSTGTITINSGTISVTDDSVAIYNGGVNITIAGGTVTSAQKADNNGTVFNENMGDGTITITGGTITAPSGGYAVYNNNGTVTIDEPPAVINGNTYGITVVTPPKYIITGSGESFTATKNGEAVGDANTPIEWVIGYIQTDADGASIEIQFGTGSVLDTGTNGIEFNNTYGTWGHITLSGKIKISVSSGAIQIADTVSVTSTADIENNGTTFSWLSNYAIVNNGTGTLTINSGTVKGTDSAPIGNFNNGTLIVNGGTLYGDKAYTLFNSGTATITGGSFTSENSHTIVNGGTMTISNATITTNTSYAIQNDGTITINSGTISTLSSCAIYNGYGNITIAGGSITSTTGNGSGGTVKNEDNQNGTITITGGTITAPTGYALYNGTGGTMTVSGTAVINGNRYGM